MANLSEAQVRKYVMELKMLYKEIFISSCVFLFCFLIWLAGGGAFWPGWLILAFVIKIFVILVSMGKISTSSFSLCKKLTFFLSPTWEEKLVQKYMKEGIEGHGLCVDFDEDLYCSQCEEKVKGDSKNVKNQIAGSKSNKGKNV